MSHLNEMIMVKTYWGSSSGFGNQNAMFVQALASIMYFGLN